MNLLRPFIECPTSELDQAWAAMVRIAEVQHARTGSQCLAQPVLYVSPGQLANHSNPEGPESEKAGRYLPARVTPAGKFTQPLYAGEAPATVEPRARDLLGIVRTAQAEARRLINGEDSGSDLAQTKLDLPETLRVLEHALSQPAAVAGPALDVTLDEDQAGLLRDMLGDPAEYEEALTVRLIVCDGHRGHGLYVAQAEYQDEGAALLAPLPAPAAPTAPQDWRIDTSTGRGILVYKNCSVIEAEQAPYVLGLIAADAAAAHAPALEAPAAPLREVLTDGQITDALWRTHLRWMEQCGIDTEGMMPTGTWLEHWLIYARAVERAALAAAPQAPAAPSAMLIATRAALAEAAKRPGELVPLPEGFKEEIRKFNLGEPSVITEMVHSAARCDRPPAGWTCTRAPGHDGPCAAAPAAPAVDAELLELAQAIVKFNREHGSVLAVHIDNLAELVDERAAQAKEGGA
ncbi:MULTISPECIES: hypothetical protein [unclassified Delftia]|nr:MULTISPECIES: hypothetical protein [unclassified Delftia]MBK0119542.1 hypothetical protein [Delftia sp. S67]MBK0130154.1 hypothetical protein [Delftia sp. S66]